MSTDLVLADDPFATQEDLIPTEKKIITGGRYRLPNLDGSHKTGGWMRVSNLVSAISDQKALQEWEIRKILRGLVQRPDLWSELQSATDDGLKAIAEEAKKAAGGNIGSEWGTAVHAEWELFGAGLGEQLEVPAQVRVAAITRRLAESGMATVPGMQERRVLIERFEACGTLDNILDDVVHGVLRIGDLKSQKKFWTYLEVEAQFALYAHGDAMWDANAECWVEMPTVDQDEAVAMWMPRDHPETTPEQPFVKVEGIDIARGWDTVRLCRNVVDRRKEAKTAKANRSGWSWLAPPAAIQIERAARRLGSVSTVAEGRAVMAEAVEAGIWGPELQAVAQKAAERVVRPL